MQASMLARRCIIFCAVSITCTTDAIASGSVPSSQTLILKGILNPTDLTARPARVRRADRWPLSLGHLGAERGTARSSGIHREAIPNEKLVFT
jgi:hypothetical protein